MMATGKQLAELVKTKVGCGYALGAQGEILTPERLAQFVRWNGRKKCYFVGYSAEKWFGIQVFDCSGLIVWAMQQLGVFKLTEDYRAQGFWMSQVVLISRNQLQPGDLLFHWSNEDDRMSHVGVFYGNNHAVEDAAQKRALYILHFQAAGRITVG